MLVVEDNLNSDARALEATVTCPSICENSVQILCSSNQHDRDVHESNQTKIGVKNAGFHAKHVVTKTNRA
jgi:hypothetical protein